MTQIRVEDTVYEVHTTTNGREKHSHLVMVGRKDPKIIGSVHRLVTWDAILDTPTGLEVISTHQYYSQALAALVHAWHTQVWELARKRIRVTS